MSRVPLALAMLVAILPGTARAQRDSVRSASVAFRGVTTVTVVVAELPDIEGRPAQLDAQLRADVERRLRRAGLRVLAVESAPPTTPYAFVRVNLTEASGGMQAWTTDVTFDQTVVLQRMPSLSTFAPTWQAAGRLGLSPSEVVAQRVLVAVGAQVDELLEAWRAGRRSR